MGLKSPEWIENAIRTRTVISRNRHFAAFSDVEFEKTALFLKISKSLLEDFDKGAKLQQIINHVSKVEICYVLDDNRGIMVRSTFFSYEEWGIFKRVYPTLFNS